MPEEAEEKVVKNPTAKKTEGKKECSTCIWWNRVRPTPEMYEIWGREMFAFGECRGMPPTRMPGGKKEVAPNDPSGTIVIEKKFASFPHTNPDDWCGMWTGSIQNKKP